MIGVIGAGGDLGRIVLEDLLTKVPGDEIRAVVADASTVEPYRSSRNIDMTGMPGGSTRSGGRCGRCRSSPRYSPRCPGAP